MVPLRGPRWLWVWCGFSSDQDAGSPEEPAAVMGAVTLAACPRDMWLFNGLVLWKTECEEPPSIQAESFNHTTPEL